MEINNINANSINTVKDKPQKPDDMKKATKEFEAFFLSYMLKTMRESVPKDGLLSGGKSEEIYTSMLDEALSKEMSERGGIGIGELMLRQLEGVKIKN